MKCITFLGSFASNFFQVDLSSESFYEWQLFLGRIPESLYDRHGVKVTLVYYGEVAKRRKGTGLPSFNSNILNLN